jgi:anti-sigma28 factor (negative regulator of flagellin synthesis)
MKVPGSDGSKDKLNALTRAQEGRIREQVVPKRAGVEGSADVGVEQGLLQGLAKPQTDKMTLSSLGAVLRQELDPVKMVDERRAKIAALKEQIHNGTYAPASQSVADSMAKELDLEIMLGGTLQDGDGTR